ncbi:hypothetical protein NQ318_003090 [Aromia moschata]|uniref:Brix domain-containing protein n=1 Tax=Aromia moschata TaxID=1265417 RepID=A0AAV8XU53_9CUCU|nr:hypothetical protein NQ318_003090 [Aromia moschata]
MGKRKKGRCVKKNINNNIEPEEVVQAPHSFVIHRGLPSSNILELTKDFRKVMEPFTASKGKKNTIKDFVAIAGPLHVSHLSIFSQTEVGMYLKIMRLPRGPTLTFKVHNYSLSRDVVSSLRKQLVVEEAFKHSPLIILNSFSGEGLQMKLMASMFQNMFPSINLTTVDLNTIRRCVLLNYNSTTKQIDFRHYTIKVVPVGISKGVKKVVQGKVPNLSRCNDIADFFEKSALLSESEAEDDPQNHVTLPQKLVSRGNIEFGKSAIRLSELGPRLTLQLIKIEDGLLDGEVLYHDLIQKTEEEKIEIQQRREAKQKLKQKRKKIQETNLKVKEQAKQEQKEKSLKGMQKGKSETDVQMKRASKESNKAAPVEEDDDREYYKEEVGEEPDKDLFSTNRSVKTSLVKRRILWERKKQGNKGTISKKGFDKTGSHNRDHRPIGGKLLSKSKFHKNKHKGKNKK